MQGLHDLREPPSAGGPAGASGSRRPAQCRRATARAEASRRIVRIGEQAARILAAIRDDPGKHAAAATYLTSYLDPIYSVLSRYLLLAERGLDSAAAALASTEQETLPKLEAALDRLYEKLHAEDVIDLEVESEMLDFQFEGPVDRLEGRIDEHA
jgi:hypothetical protein